jgi:leucine dehydrogenase
MSVFAARDFSAHEQVVFAHDAVTGLKAIIAVHSTKRGPALGGCRMWAYANEAEAITDVLRLSKGMTYKAALAELPLGGGKSVIIGDSRTQKTPELMQAMGRAVEQLAGRYIIAEDVGTSTPDMTEMKKFCKTVVGLPEAQGGSGDPSPATAWGCFLGLKQAVKHQLKADDLRGLKVAVQGLGNVGQHLCALLHEAGAKLVVADIRPENVQKMSAAYGATAVTPEAIIGAAVDVFAPCALGAVINDASLAQLKCKIVAGSANNQLAEARHGQALLDRGILYCPDYAINAGGLINVSYEYVSGPGGYNRDKAYAHIGRIASTMQTIFDTAGRENIPTSLAADRLAEARIKEGKSTRAAA